MTRPADTLPRGEQRGPADLRDSPITRLALVLTPLLCAAIAFLPITRNYFLEDDFLHLFQLRNESLVDFITMPHGGHVYLTRNTLWYLLSLVFGTSATLYFSAVLALHLVNVYLLFRLVRRFTQSPRAACFGATLWGIAPANEGSLGWLSVYGHALVATALLLVLLRLADVADGRRPSGSAVAWWMFLLFVASTSFGVGIGVVLALPAAVYLMLPPSAARTRLMLATCAVAATLPLLFLGVTRMHPSIIASGMPTSLGEQWPNAIRLFGHLVISGISGLLAGAAFAWNRPPTGFAYAIAALFMGAMLVAFWTGDPRTRRRLAACAVLAAGGYAIIAVGRAQALDQNGGVPIQVMRYHYVVPALIALMLCLMLSLADRRLAGGQAARNGLLVGAIAAMLGLHLWLGKPINHHEAARRDTATVLAAIRQQIDAAPDAAEVYIPNRDFDSIGPIIRRTPSVFPGWAAVFVIFFPDNVVDGRRVFFVEDRLGVHFQANRGRRTADLFIASDAVPQPAPGRDA